MRKVFLFLILSFCICTSCKANPKRSAELIAIDIYYDSRGFYNRINVTSNNTRIVVEKNGAITSKKIIRMEIIKNI